MIYLVNARDELYNSYIQNEWDIYVIHDPHFFSELYNMTNREVRYYLNKYVKKGKLCCIKYNNSVYYARTEWYDILKKYNKLKNVKVS